MAETVSSEESQIIHIQLLGGFQVMVGTRLIAETEWKRRKAKTLIKLLALAPDHRLHREQVMDRLWPDLRFEAAANNLHQTLHITRRILDPTGASHTRYLQLQDEMLTLCPEEPPWVDVTAFEQATSKARRRQEPAAYQAAIALYTGDLLPEDRYDDWLSNRREMLRQQYLKLLHELAQLFETQNEAALAIQTLQQLLAADPAHEEAHADLMRLYALTGRRQQALRQYQHLKKTLQQELEAEPEPKSQQLYEDILTNRFAGSAKEKQSKQEEDKEERMSSSRPYSPIPLHNLPPHLTRFIGREEEKAEVKRLQATTRLLTLTGPGGSGKTRLALEVATDLYAAPGYADGVWLVELAALSDLTLVPQAVASALGVRETTGQPLTETLVSHLQSKKMLLVLDNCEHLIAACATLADTLLRACPGLRILATSREPLHIPGELTWPVPPLSMPDPQQLPPVEKLVQYEAVQLIIDRATAILPTFTVNQYNAPAIAQVCHQLDGLPLAIELAAARVKLLTMAQIAARLQDSFRLLVGGNRLALTRQQTLQAALDWSYELLSEPERVLFRRLAVFAGGFTLEAAEGICPGDGLDPSEFLDLLSQLVDKSLVTVREDDQARRYGLLETVRQYSTQKLRASGDEAKIRIRHQQWYLALALEADRKLYGPRQAEWLDRLETEHDNLRAALAWSAPDERERRLGLRLARALFWFWYLSSYLSEGQAWFEKALAETDASQQSWERAMALFGSGIIAMFQGNITIAGQRLEKSIALWRMLGNNQDNNNEAGHNQVDASEELATALLSLGTVRLNQGDERAARALLEECLGLFQESGHETLYAVALTHLGDVALRQGDWAAARARYEECLTLQQKLAYPWGIAQVLNNLGEVARCETDYERAARLYDEGLALFRELDSSADVARSLHNLGYVALARGDAGRAATLFAESLALFRERGGKRGIVECLAGFAGVAAIQADFRRAAQLLGAVDAQFEHLGAAMWPADRLESERNLTNIRATLGEEIFTASWKEGRTLTLEQAMELIQIGG